MGFGIFILFCNLMTPAVMIVAGYFMWKHAPKNINSVIGYRTSRSMKNMDTWKFAHEFCGKLWWYIGWIMMFPSAVVSVCVLKKSETTVSIISCILLTIQVIVLIGSIIPTEIALRKNFTEDGTPKN